MKLFSVRNMSAALLLMSLGAAGYAQENPGPMPDASSGVTSANQISGTGPPPANDEYFLRRFRQKVVSVKMCARVISAQNEELWTAESDKKTIPGRPIVLRLVGANIVVVVQFIPYLRNNSDWVLVAQGQVWLEDAADGLRYETTLQTIPVKLNERIYYFPIGSNKSRTGDYIEVSVELNPYP